MTQPLNRRAPFFQALLLLAGALLGTPTPARADAPAPKRATAKYEVRFMTNMIDHHAMAVMMAELCEERAAHTELLELCGDMKATQTAEIQELQGWLQEWYGITHEPEMSPGMERQMERLAALSGREFEIEFMKMMIRHHWQAILEAAQCERRVSHVELRELCREIISAQMAEIGLMQDWLCHWYRICFFGPRLRHAHQ